MEMQQTHDEQQCMATLNPDMQGTPLVFSIMTK
jgi:hypothetical protein